jgi:hypothetical protein
VQEGASLKELMARLGHSSTRAVLIYQHATRDRHQAIAKALGGLAQQVTRQEATISTRAAKMRDACGPWPMCGPNRAHEHRRGRHAGRLMPVDLVFLGRASEGNRTLMNSLEGCGPQSSELLRPRSGHVRLRP